MGERRAAGAAAGREALPAAGEVAGRCPRRVPARRRPAWPSRCDRPDQPDYVLFDIDPTKDKPFAAAVDAAHRTREALELLELEAFVRTTGGAGLHVLVPNRATPHPVPQRIARRGDLHEPLLHGRRRLDRAIASLAKEKGQ